jgi:hypothetical protein
VRREAPVLTSRPVVILLVSRPGRCRPTPGAFGGGVTTYADYRTGQVVKARATPRRCRLEWAPTSAGTGDAATRTAESTRESGNEYQLEIETETYEAQPAQDNGPASTALLEDREAENSAIHRCHARLAPGSPETRIGTLRNTPGPWATAPVTQMNTYQAAQTAED